MTPYADLDTPARILLGPGPSMVPPRVLRAMAQPLAGHLDPQFIVLMNEVQDLRFVFQTENRLTIPVSGTGSAGMEAALGNGRMQILGGQTSAAGRRVLEAHGGTR